MTGEMKRTMVDYLKIKYIRKIAAVVIAAAVFGAGIRMLDYMYVTEDDWGAYPLASLL